MQINRVYSGYGAYANASHFRKTENKGENTARDEVSMSGKAREYQQARSALSHVPDVRTEKIAILKQRVESGNYKVPAADLATKMMAEYFA